MHAMADEIIRRTGEAGRMISRETGKPIAQAQREWGLTVDQFRWCAEEARRSPKFSSAMTFMPSVTSVSTVGLDAVTYDLK